MPDVERWTSYDEMADDHIDDSWHGGAAFLYGRCFGWDVLDAQLAAGNYSKIYGNLYGALYSGSVYAGQFHTGVDINYFHGATIKSPVDGTIVQYMKTDDSLNTVIILGADGFYYNFLHMEPLAGVGKGTKVVAGVTPIGKQSNIGLGYAANTSTDSHLHVEVKALDTGATPIPKSSFNYIGSYYPYDIYYAW